QPAAAARPGARLLRPLAVAHPHLRIPAERLPRLRAGGGPGGARVRQLQDPAGGRGGDPPRPRDGRRHGRRGGREPPAAVPAGRRTQQYEIEKMKDNIAELEAGIVLANDQLAAAVQRAAAAEVLWQAALQRTAMAAASLDAFDAEFFTPEAWSKMADVMRDIG